MKATADPTRKVFCPFQGIVGCATHQLDEQTRGLLHSRLRSVDAVFLGAVVVFLAQGFLTRAPYWQERFAPLAIFAALLLFLRPGRALSPRALRLTELLLFGVMALHVSLINYLGIVQYAVQGDVLLASTVISRITIGFFALIVVYGMFIPNNGVRAALMMIPFLLTPAATVLLAMRHPAVRQAAGELVQGSDLSYMFLMLTVAAGTSVFGSHTMYSMRRGTAEVQEMGMYALLEKLGEGGMGEVWKAEHQLLARTAAIKMIRADAVGAASAEERERILQRFQREAQATASLSSPHTVELYDFGVTQTGLFYYVMEYLDGLDLETLVRRFGPLPAERVAFLLAQAAESLGEAHAQGLIHRDVKPSNLFLSSAGLRDDFVKVLDFGLVKQEGKKESNLTLTREGTTTGTPAYMSPEMVTARDSIDERADIYSLGCVAYWLLTGSLVFDSGTAMEMVIDHVKTKPVPPSRRTELPIPAELERLVLDCLEKDPAQRPQSMREFARRLAECRLADDWTADRASSWWQQHMPQAQRAAA